jgi:hypothetical protein
MKAQKPGSTGIADKLHQPSLSGVRVELESRVKFNLEQEKLKHYREGIGEAQTGQINDPRVQLCARIRVCDYQPYDPSSAQRSSRPEPAKMAIR